MTDGDTSSGSSGGQHEEWPNNEETIPPVVPETSDSDYVLLINREHDYDDPNAKCLVATNADRGELKLVKCNRDNHKHHWLNKELEVSSDSSTVKLRPRSDPSLCVTRGEIDTPPSNIHCCVDDARLHLKTCNGSSKQLWSHDRAFGFFSPAGYDTLCLASWFSPRVGISYCAFPAIEKSSYGEYRFDVVDPANGLTRPEATAEGSEDMFWIESTVDQMPRRLWCSVSDGGQNCKVVTEKDYWDGDIDEDFDSVDAIWLRDGDGRLRSASDPSICLTHDAACRNLYATACYQYRDDHQVWRHGVGGNMELSPEGNVEVCAAAKLGDDPPVEPCRSGLKKLSWSFVPFKSKTAAEPSTCDDDSDDTYMIVWKGGEGYYCAEGGGDAGDELELEQCDTMNQNQIFLYQNNRWMPKSSPDLCVQAVKNEDTGGLRVPMLMHCDGSKKQKWTFGGDGKIKLAKDDLCASYNFDKRTWFYNFVLKDCTDGGNDDRSFQLVNPKEYTAPILKYILLSTKNDLSWGISCYPDHEGIAKRLPEIAV